MSTERLIEASHGNSETLWTSPSFRHSGEPNWIFEELPQATVVSVSRPDTGDISPILLSYTIELQYKQVSFSVFLFSVNRIHRRVFSILIIFFLHVKAMNGRTGCWLILWFKSLPNTSSLAIV